MASVLGRISEDQVFSEPYHFVHTTEALAPTDYKALEDAYPDWEALFPRILTPKGLTKYKTANNMLMHVPGIQALQDVFEVAPVWKDFLAYHYSQAFFDEVIKLLGDGMRQSYPDLEDKLGKPLEELTIQPRREPDRGADVTVEVQFAINTPVREPDRVRARHVDIPKKLFSGLFYMREPGDETEGGDLEICRWTEPPLFRRGYAEGVHAQNTHIDDDQCEVVDVVKYRANTAIFFVDSVDAIHGVTARQPTPHLRRYMNFVAEMREDLYDITAYNEKPKEVPWALMMGNN